MQTTVASSIALGQAIFTRTIRDYFATYFFTELNLHKGETSDWGADHMKLYDHDNRVESDLPMVSDGTYEFLEEETPDSLMPLHTTFEGLVEKSCREWKSLVSLITRFQHIYTHC